MCNDSRTLILAEVTLFAWGAVAFWYSFRVNEELAFGKRTFRGWGAGWLWDATESWFAPGRPDIRARVYRIVAYAITAFFWGLGVFFIIAMPRCP